MSKKNGNTNGDPGSVQMEDALVLGRSSQGVEIRATLIRVTRYLAVFEFYDPGIIFRVSEVIADFKIIIQGRTLYYGNAVVRSLVNAGIAIVCEATLTETCWQELALSGITHDGTSGLRGKFSLFMQERENLYKIKPAFKLAVADMQSFLADLRLWCEQIELSVRSEPSSESTRREEEALAEVREPVLSALAAHFESFEEVARDIELDLRPAHNVYAKRQLHPLVLCAPFMYRTFKKPLGYAGDYEMVNMMMRDSFQGSSTFAKILNTFFLNTPPVVAHRNRVEYLVDMLAREMMRLTRAGNPGRIINVGCGPAQELQKFLAKSEFAVRSEFTLLDFNEETIHHVQSVINQIKTRHAPQASFNFIKKSVHHLLKTVGRTTDASDQKYDLVYCAGLFDYLSNNVCRQLMSIMYNWLAPGGLLLITNVDTHNPSLGWMEYVVDWHLYHRDPQEVARFAPKQAPIEATRVLAEDSGLNIILEIRKPQT